MELAVARRASCARRCSASSTSSPAAARSTTSRATSPRFLDEVDERPPPLDAAMRMADTQRRARGARAAAAAAGVRHMAHRFIVGETPGGGARRRCAASGSDGVATLGRPARRGDRHRRGGRPLRRTAARDALDDAGRGDRALARRGRGSSATRPAPLPRANLSRQGLRADAAAAPRRARASGKRDAAARLRALLRARARPRRAPAHRHGVARLARGGRSSSCSSCSPRTSSRDGPSAGRRPPGLPARLARARSTRIARRGRARRRARAPLVVRLVKGAYWDHEVVEARQHGWTRAGVRGQGRVRPQLRGAHPAAARRAARACASRSRSHNLRSVAHAIAYNRAARRRRRATSSSRSCAASATTSQHALAADGPARAHLLPGRRPRRRAWPTSCAGCSRTRRNESFLREPGRAARRSRSCWRRRERAPTFAQRADRSSCAARRARARCSAALARARRRACRCACRCWIGDDAARRRRSSSRPTRASPSASSRVAGARHARPTSTRAVEAARARRARLGRAAGGASAPRCSSRAAASLRERRARARRARGARVREAVGRGRRRRLRGDRLPRVLRARRGRARARAGSCSRCPASATRCATRRAASSR